MGLSGFAAQVVTAFVDYGRFITLCALTVLWATDQNVGTLIPHRLAALQIFIVAQNIFFDTLWAIVLAPDTMAEVKSRQIMQDVRSSRMLWINLRFSCIVAGGVGVGAWLGMFQPLILPVPEAEAIERVKTFAGNNPAAILRIRSAWLCTDQCYTATVPYMEFWVISVVKDALAMHFAHRWMHNSEKFPWLASIHHDHHTYTSNLNLIGAAKITGVDFFLENGVGPILLILLKLLLNIPPTVSILSYLLLVASEGNAHSANPYSITYFFPPIDFLLKGNIAHNLHHAKPKTNFHLVPWHHLWRGTKEDVQEYNRIMHTRVRF